MTLLELLEAAAEMDSKDSKAPDANVSEKGKEPVVKPGMISDVKNLYQTKPDNRGKSTWVDKYPDDLEEAAENAETARYALLIRNKKCYDGRKTLQIDSIVVQSPLLKKALGFILKDYPGITTSLERLTFSAPFQPFVHRWSKLVEAVENEEDSESKAHLELFHKTLEVELHDAIKARDDFILNGVITYDTCWMIFEPGSTVFTIDDGQKSAARLVNGYYHQTRCGNCYALDCEVVDWDGENFGWDSTRLNIWEFQGTAKITKLSAFPLEYHPVIEKVKADLIQRGKSFETLHGYHYKHYQGIAIGQGPWGPIKYNVDSRIIIDTYAWNRFNPNRQVSLSALGKAKKSRRSTGWDSDDEIDGYDYEDEEYDYEYDEDDSDDECEDLQDARCGPSNNEKLLASLTKEQLLLCSTSLKGYSLKNKKWLTFSIGSVKDIQWNDGAFESLVLPQDHKELILALTESQVQNKNGFDDVIQGQGMIMLLSGPPGVGKTLTAESVAETMRAPLYMMSAGDLGLDSSSVESSLSNVLEMSTKWNAVLLLDEADVFLEQRSAHDLERNKLVSIFLRILEYYEGILFLTTNRVENIDAAFQSRIHISMEYQDLSFSSRRHVWANFLHATSSRQQKHAFSDADLDRLAGYTMNGREIKNVLKTAKLLAGKQGVDLSVQHVETVLKIEKRHVGGGGK
ncbi:hypothetical protein MMC22_012108 [Lobaria immixta]|nr:hypothetical protein [Lobaria immixta]